MHIFLKCSKQTLSVTFSSCDSPQSSILKLKKHLKFNPYPSSSSSYFAIVIAISAAMRPALPAPAPSSTLLKFLRSQSENISFFSPYPRPGFTFDHAAPPCPLLRSHAPKSSSKSSARYLSTTTARHATVEARFLNLDSLGSNRSSQPKSPQCRFMPRIRKPQYQNISLAHRAASTGWHHWREKVWEKGPVLQPDDLPDSLCPRDDRGDSIFSLGRHISAKTAAQLSKVRCTQIDENGNVVLASGEFKKSELIAKVY